MQNYFHRQIQLWGQKTQTQLQSKKIAIVGSGGLGSSLAFALGASGIGEIHMIALFLPSSPSLNVICL